LLLGAALLPISRAQTNGDVEIRSTTQESAGGVSRAEGAVEVRKGAMIVSADKAVYDEATGMLEAEGNVRFQTAEGVEDIQASRVIYNVNTEEGSFYDVHGFLSSASQGGARILTTDNPFYLEGSVVHKTADSYVVHDGVVTNCELDDMWWSLSSPRTTIRPGESATIRHGILRLKGVPILYMPVFTKSLERLPRRSGFLTPNIGNSSRFGLVFGQAYYWAVNRSYDATFNGTLYTDRGLASQLSLRGRPTSHSNFNAVFFGVKDRGLLLANGDRLKQGGASFSIDGVAQLPGGFRGVADVNYLSSLEFRQAFTQTFEEAVQSQVRSTGFVTKNFSSYSFNGSISREENFQDIARDNTIVIRKLPGFEFNGRNRRLTEGRIPLFFGFNTSFDLVSRIQPEFETRNFVQRGDFFPRISTNVAWKGFHLTPTFGVRATGYGQRRSNDVLMGENLYRTAGEFSLDIVPPALQRIYNGPAWLGQKVKHVIEPRLRYRYTSGIDDFGSVIRFDDRDVMSNTNELELSLTQRLYAKSTDGSTREVLALGVWQRRYFDPEFGGAVAPGVRNVLRSSLDVTPFAFIDQARNYSPVIVSLTTRPNWKTGLEWSAGYDPLRQKVVNSNVTLDYRFNRLIGAAVGHTAVRTPTTLSPASNQVTSLVRIGDFNRRGWNAAVYNIYDYRLHNFIYTRSQISYNTDCCGFGIEYGRFAIGPTRTENQFRVSLSIANVGSFGTLRPQERLF
jgi:LPS-assembly protein